MVAEAGPGAGCEVHVRVNDPAGGRWEDDLEAVVHPGLRAIRLPKVEDAHAIRQVAAALDQLERDAGCPSGSVGVYPIIESARGVSAAEALLTASPRVVRLAIGTSDLLADLGIVDGEDPGTLMIRSQLVLTSRITGAGPPVDSVYTDLDDEAGLREAARWARSLGFHGKSVIHPRQLGPVHEVFTPTETELARARRIVTAYDDAKQAGSGAVSVDGEFIDAAIVARAAALLGRRSD